MSKILAAGLSLLVLAGTLYGQPAAKRAIGDPGAWSGTIAAAALDGRLYTIESSGALYATDPATGRWQQLGKPEFGNTAFLFAFPDGLATIETDGSLYLVNPADGSWKQSGQAGDWKGTIAGAVLGGKLYTVESTGALYVTDPASGTWQQLGKADFAQTEFMFAPGNALATIEKDGSLYLVNPADGSWKPAGKPGEWKATIAGAAMDGKLFTVEADGIPYVTDSATGRWEPIGKAEFVGTKFLLAAAGSLYAIDEAGNLAGVTGGPAAPASAPLPAAAETAPVAAVEEELANDPAAAGALTFKFMGAWKGDPEQFEKDPEYRRQAAAAPEMAKGLAEMMRGMTMNVGFDGITMTVMGDKAGPFEFSVVAGSGNTLLIVMETGPKAGVKSKVIFTDDTHIQVVEQGPAGKAMYFKK